MKRVTPISTRTDTLLPYTTLFRTRDRETPRSVPPRPCGCGRRYIRSRGRPSLGLPKHLLGLAPLAPRRAFPYRSPRLIRPATGQGSQGMDSGRGGWRILLTATACGRPEERRGGKECVGTCRYRW